MTLFENCTKFSIFPTRFPTRIAWKDSEWGTNLRLALDLRPQKNNKIRIVIILLFYSNCHSPCDSYVQFVRKKKPEATVRLTWQKSALVERNASLMATWFSQLHPRCNKTHRFITTESNNYFPTWHYTLPEYLPTLRNREPLVCSFFSRHVSLVLPSLELVIVRSYSIYRLTETSLRDLRDRKLFVVAEDSIAMLNRALDKRLYKGFAAGNLFILISRCKI